MDLKVDNHRSIIQKCMVLMLLIVTILMFNDASLSEDTVPMESSALNVRGKVKDFGTS